ncbi:Gfo/Idh/MocA family protein [bacterium]
MNFGIIGCGLIGHKRAQSIFEPHKITQIFDTDFAKADCLADAVGNDIKVRNSAKELIQSEDVDVVIIATPHNSLAPLTLEAVKAGKHVLVEKPAACSSMELDIIIPVMEQNQVLVKVGFNHRFHPAVIKAYEIYKSGEIGELMYIRGRYGHGGRIGYDKEWRAVKSVSGGGEMVDQGSHLIDLSRWFLGDFSDVSGFVNTYFWDMQVEDNCFLMLKTELNKVAWLHASWTEWKNTFSFEIFGEKGKLQIDGLGKSYGTEKLTYYKMLPELGPPETSMWEYPFNDNSWNLELEEFLNAISLGRAPLGNLYDARASLYIIEKIYKQVEVIA